MAAHPPDRVDRIVAEWERERPDLDVGAQQLIGRLHRLGAVLTSRLVPVYEAHGLGEGEFDVLCALRRAGAPYERQPAELARTTMITTGAATKRIDRLQRAGLVLRVRRPTDDGRAVRVRLTAEGRRLVDEALTAHAANEEQLVSALGPRDRATLTRILRTWLADLAGDEA
ncbi:MAG: MarR family transcriptional regulator [Actinomycetota bacterium]|nr:MarR family transcriptional regulator [Actinomycetota bacterium]